MNAEGELTVTRRDNNVAKTVTAEELFGFRLHDDDPSINAQDVLTRQGIQLLQRVWLTEMLHRISSRPREVDAERLLGSVDTTAQPTPTDPHISLSTPTKGQPASAALHSSMSESREGLLDSKSFSL